MEKSTLRHTGHSTLGRVYLDDVVGVRLEVGHFEGREGSRDGALCGYDVVGPAEHFDAVRRKRVFLESK